MYKLCRNHDIESFIEDFPELTKFTVANCSKLSSIWLRSPKLKILSVMRCDLRDYTWNINTLHVSVGLDVLNVNFTNCSQLEIFKVNFSKITRAHVVAPFLRHLDLSNNEITSVYLDCPKLLILDLSDNKLASVPDMNCTRLRMINFEINCLTDSYELGDLITKNTHLKHILLDSNGIYLLFPIVFAAFATSTIVHLRLTKWTNSIAMVSINVGRVGNLVDNTIYKNYWTSNPTYFLREFVAYELQLNKDMNVVHYETFVKQLPFPIEIQHRVWDYARAPLNRQMRCALAANCLQNGINIRRFEKISRIFTLSQDVYLDETRKENAVIVAAANLFEQINVEGTPASHLDKYRVMLGRMQTENAVNPNFETVLDMGVPLMQRWGIDCDFFTRSLNTIRNSSISFTEVCSRMKTEPDFFESYPQLRRVRYPSSMFKPNPCRVAIYYQTLLHVIYDNPEREIMFIIF